VPIYSSSTSPSASGATVGELVDRLYRDYLHPSDDQPVILPLGAAIDDTETAITFDADMLAPDEEGVIGPGIILELGTEQVRVVIADPTAGTATVTRGVNGTTPASHAVTGVIRVAPTFTRKTVFDAICDNVVSLYPDLWRTETTTIMSAREPVDVPAEIVTVADVTRLTASGRPQPVTVELMRNFPPSATGMAVMFNGTPSGVTVYLTYEARFPRPTSEDDDLAADFGVDGSWDRIVLAGAAAQVLAGRPFEAVTADFITEQLEQEGYPVGSSQNIRNGLLQLHSMMLRQARRDLRASRVPPVVMML